MRRRALVLWLRLVALVDRLRLRFVLARHPGLEIHPEAGRELALARFDLAPGARLRIEAGVVTERRPGALCFELGPDAEVVIGAGTWLSVRVDPVLLSAYAGARLRIGEGNFLNGCQISCKERVSTGRHTWIGPGSRIYDADQHDFDADRPERSEPVTLGDHVWVASDVTILRGVRIGDHAVIGTRSLVTRDVPAHKLAYGIPARVRGEVGDRSNAR